MNSYSLFLGDDRPARTRCARCRAVVGVVAIDGHSFLVDELARERLPNGFHFDLAVHDCGRTRARSAAATAREGGARCR